MLFLKAGILLLSFIVADSDTYTIPLNQIWALNMPGTKDMYDLESVPNGLPEQEFLRRSAILRMVRNLQGTGNKGSDKYPVGFVVRGTDKVALELASNILTGKSKRQEIFPTGEELTLVFYTHSSGRYVRLDEVQRRGNDITIRYHFETASAIGGAVYVALIPLGKLGPSGYPVWIKRSPPVYGRGAEYGPVSARLVKEIISDSFEFAVTKKK